MPLVQSIVQPITAPLASPADGSDGGVPAKKYFLNTTGGSLWFSDWEYRAYGDNVKFRSQLIGGAPLNNFLNNWQGENNYALLTYLGLPIVVARDFADAQVNLGTGVAVVSDQRFDWDWSHERDSFSGALNGSPIESANDEEANPVDMRGAHAYYNEIASTSNIKLDSVELNSVTGIQDSDFVQFNNVDIFARFPLIELTGDFRIHLWVRRAKGGGANTRMALWNGLTGTEDAAWIYDTDAPGGADNRWLLKSENSTIMFTSGAFDAIRDEQDVELELVREGTSLQLYLDGDLVSDLTSSATVRISDIGRVSGDFHPSLMSNITVENRETGETYVLDMSGQDVVNAIDARMRNLDPDSARDDEVVIENEAPDSYEASWTDEGGGVFSIDGSQVSNQDIVFSPPDMEAGMCYRVAFTVSDYSAGSVSVRCGDADGGIWVSSNGAKELFVRCGTTPGDGLVIHANTDFDATVSDIVIRRTYDGQWFNVDPETDIVSIPRQSRKFFFTNKTNKPYVRDLLAPPDENMVETYRDTHDPDDYAIASNVWKTENGTSNQQDGSFRFDGVSSNGRLWYKLPPGIVTDDKAFEGWIEVRANRPEDVGKTLKAHLQRDGLTSYGANTTASIYTGDEVVLSAEWQRVYAGVHHNYEITGQVGFRVGLWVHPDDVAEGAWVDVRNPEIYDISRHALMNNLDPDTDFEEA